MSPSKKTAAGSNRTVPASTPSTPSPPSSTTTLPPTSSSPTWSSPLPTVTPSTVNPPASSSSSLSPVPLSSVAPPFSAHREYFHLERLPLNWKSIYYAKIFHYLFHHLPPDDFLLFRRGQWPSVYTCEDAHLLSIIDTIINIFQEDIMNTCTIQFSFTDTSCHTTFLEQNILLTILSFFDSTISSYNWSNSTAKVFSLREFYADSSLQRLFDRLAMSLRISVGAGFPSDSLPFYPPLFTSTIDFLDGTQLITSFDEAAGLAFHLDTSSSLAPDLPSLPQSFIDKCLLSSCRAALTKAELVTYRNIDAGPHAGYFSCS